MNALIADDANVSRKVLLGILKHECECEDVEKLMSAGCVRPQGIAAGSGGFDAPACKPGG